MIFRRIACGAIAFALRAGIAFAGANVWTAVGPEGGDVYCLARDPSDPMVLYAGTERNGLFQTTNGGQRWSSIASEVPDENIRAVVVNPGNPQVVYIATGGNGVFKSSDRGKTWAASNSGMTDLRLGTLAMDPSNPAVLYAGSNFQPIYKSVNGGATWVALTNGLPSWGYRSIAVHPTDPSIVYAGASGGVFKSVDGGQNWQNVSTGFLIAAIIRDLVVIPGDPSILLAAAEGLGQGIGRSLDGGDTWAFTQISPGVLSLAVDPASPLVVYAGTGGDSIRKTTDGGATWGGPSPPATSYFADLVFDSATPANLYAATRRGVYRTVNGGGWVARTAGIINVVAYSVAVDAGSPRTVYAGTGPGTSLTPIVRSVDAGQIWENTGVGGLTGSALATDPVTAGTVYAYGETFIKTVNGGATWFPANSGLPTNAGIFRTVVDPVTPSTLFVGTLLGPYRSIDGAASWTLMNSGLGTPPIPALAIDPTNHQIVYAGTRGSGVFKSVDSGATWNPSSKGLTDLSVWSLAVDPAVPAEVYAGTEASGIFKSENAGASWSPRSAGLPAGVVRDLVIDSRDRGTVYAAVEGGGVFVTLDAGATWRALNDNLTNRNVLSLALGSAGYLYAGTFAGGVFARRVGRSAFYTLTPCRLIDTRDPASVPGALPLDANSERSFSVTNRCGVPATARSLAVTLTVVNPAAVGHVTLFPTGATVPPTSSINYSAGRTRTGNGIVGLGAVGSFTARCVQSTGTVDLIVDLSGYFE